MPAKDHRLDREYVAEISNMETNKNYSTFSEWLSDQKDYGLCAPPITAEQAFKFIKAYLLPENWYVEMSMTGAQTDCVALDEILRTYSAKYRKECSNLDKDKNNNRTGILHYTTRVLKTINNSLK